MSFSTHVLDTARGRPAAGLGITLERLVGDAFEALGAGTTNDDGRVQGLVSNEDFVAGTYRITFATGAWFDAQGLEGFYPEVRVEFTVRAADEHYHVPLLLSPYGYSTYRGS